MTLIPMRTVSSQVASELHGHISKGTWQEWLPSERVLCQQFQVSRSTLRSALLQLKHDGVVTATHGVGYHIAFRPPLRGRAGVRSVALLAPKPISHLRPNTAHWIDELKDQLHALGYELRYQNVRNCYQAEPERALNRLLRRETHAVWILVLTNKPMQRWFQENKIPCVVAGSLFEGISLPSVDFDSRAVCRHAAGVLVGAGHKRLVYLTHKPRSAGDIESECGFLEAVSQSRSDGISGLVAHHDESKEGIAKTIRRLMDQDLPPTGLIVSNSNLFLSTVTALASRGLRVPEDVSLICKDDALFLSHVMPDPTRYISDDHTTAKKLITQVLHQIQCPLHRSADIRLFPHFHKGASVKPPRAAAAPRKP